MVDKLKRFFAENLGLKIISLFLAFSLWIFVKGSMREEVDARAVVELREVPSHLIVTSVEPEAVNLRLRGFLSQLATLSPRDLRIIVDLRDATQGLNVFKLHSTDLQIPRGVEVLAISPSQVEVRLSRVISKVVRIRPLIKGRPREGFTIKEIKVDPPYVMLRGNPEELDELTEVKTEEIDISGIDEGLYAEVPLQISNLRLKGEPIRKVRIKVEVERR